MKIWGIIGFIGILAGLGWWRQNPVRQPENSSGVTPIPATITPTLRKYLGEQQQIAYEAWLIPEDHQLTLRANFIEQFSAETIINNYGCILLVNGGFYNRGREPLGWLMTREKVLGAYESSRLLNGFLIEAESGWQITQNLTGQLLSGVQTGPMLIADRKIEVFEKGNEEGRRRIAAVETTDNWLGFVVLYNPETVFGGPTLAETPSLIEQMGQLQGWQIKAAINLDGGSASFFYLKNGLFLQEFEPVGSYFCVTKG